MNLEGELHHLIDNALSDDARLALAACRTLQREQLPWLTHRAVISARRAGWSWATIGKLSGISPQAARKRFAHLDDVRPPEVSPRRAMWDDELDRRYFDHQRHSRLTAELRDWELSGVDIVPW